MSSLQQEKCLNDMQISEMQSYPSNYFVMFSFNSLHFILFQNPISKRDEEISSSDAFIFVYSVTSNESFREVTKLIETVKNSSALSIVIGNKKDLHHLREVGLDEGRNFAEKYGCLFYEISVAEGYHETFRVFNELLKHIIMKKASDEGLSGKKKGNSSFSSILKGIDKAKQAR